MQADIRKRYLELVKKTHPDVASGEDDASAFRQIKFAYEQLSQPAQGIGNQSNFASERNPPPAPSAGAQAFRRERASMSKVGMAMQLAAEGQRAEALELFLMAVSDGKPLPGQGQAAALSLFDACTAFSVTQQSVEHAQVAALWQWLLEHDAIDSKACEAWRWMSIRSMQPAAALEAHRVAASYRDDPGFASNVWRGI